MYREELRSTARKYLDLGRTAEVYLVPEGWASDAWAPTDRQRAAAMGQ